MGDDVDSSPASAGLGPNNKLRRLAELEMRRSAEPTAHKRPKLTTDVGRLDYGAPAQLEKGIQGFLLTSKFDREKSAIKEAVVRIEAALARVQGSHQDGSGNTEDNPGEENPVCPLFSSIKLAGQGMCALKLCGYTPCTATSGRLKGGGSSREPTAEELVNAAALGAIRELDDPGSGRDRPKFLQRCTPIQATCRSDAAELEAAVKRLARAAEQWRRTEWTDADLDPQNAEHVLRFAVAFRPRIPTGQPKPPGSSHGQSVPGGKGETGASGPAEAAVPPDRAAVIAAAARGLQEGLGHWASSVKIAADLLHPDSVLLVEQLPVRGAKTFLAICLVPGSMCTVKPRLALKSLSRQ